MPNPVQFTVNEMVFAVNTTDILFHLSGDEVARNPQNTDRMGRLSKYLVQQRKYVCFYAKGTYCILVTSPFY